MWHEESYMHPVKPWIWGLYPVENIRGIFLSHRPASRLGDDIVIWSLLPEEKVHNSAFFGGGKIT